MGAIVRAVDPELGRPVAIKVILGGLGASRHQVARFLREARITSQLAHPNIPPVHDLGRTTEGQLYFVMKWIEGHSLAEVLGKITALGEGALATERPVLLRAMVRVCEALAFAHSRGVIHRDLKPANVMLGEFGEVLVMDWGLARLAEEADIDSSRTGLVAETDPLETQEGHVLGTPAYMPPEQAEGKVGRIDERSDVYALGALLYTILTGEPPFRGANSRATLVLVVEGRLVGPRERVPGAMIPPALEAIVLKAMARRPDDRYRSVEELQADLEAHLLGRRGRAGRVTRSLRLAPAATIDERDEWTPGEEGRAPDRSRSRLPGGDRGGRPRCPERALDPCLGGGPRAGGADHVRGAGCLLRPGPVAPADRETRSIHGPGPWKRPLRRGGPAR
jgi:serine/threonine-protein kinase